MNNTGKVKHMMRYLIFILLTATAPLVLNGCGGEETNESEEEYGEVDSSGKYRFDKQNKYGGAEEIDKEQKTKQ